MTQCAVINLKKETVPDPNPNKDLPRQYHETTGLVLPVEKNPIQAEVNKLKTCAKKNGDQQIKNQNNAFQPSRKNRHTPQSRTK